MPNDRNIFATKAPRHEEENFRLINKMRFRISLCLRDFVA